MVSLAATMSGHVTEFSSTLFAVFVASDTAKKLNSIQLLATFYRAIICENEFEYGTARCKYYKLINKYRFFYIY